MGKCNVKFLRLGDMESTEKNAVAMEAQLQPEAEAVPAEKPKRVPRWMVKFICLKCGRLNYKMCEDKIEFVCFGCGASYEFQLNELAKVDYVCSECGTKQYFWMPDVEGMALCIDECKACGNKTALSYSHQNSRYEAF